MHGVNSPKPLSLRFNFASTLVGNVLFALSQWGMLVLIARLSGPESVGMFVLGLSIAGPVFVVTNIDMRSVQATDVSAKYRFADYFGLRTVLTVCGLVAIVVIAFSGMFRSALGLVILAVGLCKSIESLEDVAYGALQRRERMDRIAMLQSLKGVSLLLAFALVLFATESLLLGILALSLARLLFFVVLDLSSVRWAESIPVRGLAPSWDSGILKRLVYLSLPLVTAKLLLSLQVHLPRYFVQAFAGEEKLGEFACIAYILVAASTVTSAVSQAALPRLSREYAAQDFTSFARIVFVVMQVIVLVGVVGVLIAYFFGDQILAVVYGSSFAKYGGDLFWLSIAMSFRLMTAFLNNGLRAMQCFFLLLAQSAISLCILIALLVALVPSYQITGAIFSILAGAAIDFLVCGASLAYVLRSRSCEVNSGTE